MQITERRVGHAVILDVVGELTYANRAAFKSATEQVKQTGCRHVIVNMEGVRFLDSSALGMLALLSQSLKVMQGTVGLLNPQSYVREIISLANLHRMMPIYNTERDALTGCSLPAA